MLDDRASFAKSYPYNFDLTIQDFSLISETTRCCCLTSYLSQGMPWRGFSFFPPFVNVIHRLRKKALSKIITKTDLLRSFISSPSGSHWFSNMFRALIVFVVLAVAAAFAPLSSRWVRSVCSFIWLYMMSVLHFEYFLFRPTRTTL